MLTLLHPLVDFCSVAVLASGGTTLERWLAYNALAFALQLPLGVALDVLGGGRSGIGRAGFAVGCALAAGGGSAAAFGFSGWLPLVAACVGNALFHLTAGANVLERSPGRSGPVGLFISTGAIGLMAGQMAATGGAAGVRALPGWAAAVVAGVAVALVAGAAWQTVRWRGMSGHVGRVTLPSADGRRGAAGVRALPVVVAGLFALVVWRSWAGLLAGGMSSGAGLAFVLAGAAVTWAGKAAGGYAADVLGALLGADSANPAALAKPRESQSRSDWHPLGDGVVMGRVSLRETRDGGFESASPVEPVTKTIAVRGLVTGVSVAGSAVLCFACSPSHAALWLVLLFVAQLATGPVLSLMYDLSGRRAGSAFGLNCLGLFTGSLV